MLYPGIVIAAAVEGEVAYLAAAALVAQGHLHPLGVVAAGAAGASIGDQFYFYLLRGRIAGWCRRFPTIERAAARLVPRVRTHAAPMILAIRFAPGLRIALAAACAYADVPPLRFSLLNVVTAVLWAVVLLVLAAYVGPSAMARLGIGGWQATALAAVVVFGLVRLVGGFGARGAASAQEPGGKPGNDGTVGMDGGGVPAGGAGGDFCAGVSSAFGVSPTTRPSRSTTTITGSDASEGGPRSTAPSISPGAT
jgi:membrane protein DedA with SNARE-associated domain